MRIARERYAQLRANDGDWLGPRSANFEAFARHILRHFNEAIDAYTQPKYALQDFLQYKGTQRAISKIVRQLIGRKRTFVFVGDKFTAGNSPVRGYIRTAVRALVEELKRHWLCHVYVVDEFRTTKLCSLCFRLLEQPIKRMHRGQPNQWRRIKRKYRYYLCRGCVNAKHGDSIEAQRHIDSRKSNKQLTRQRREFARNVEDNPEIADAVARYASKYRRYAKPNQGGINKTWNRDVNAGRNIFYKGMYDVFKKINWGLGFNYSIRFPFFFKFQSKKKQFDSKSMCI